MAHICKWKNYNSEDKELRKLIKRIWGEEFYEDKGRLEILMKDTSWLNTFTMFCANHV